MSTTNLHEVRLINVAWRGPDGAGWGELFRAGLRPEQMESPDAQQVYAFALDKHTRFGAWPSETLVKQNFPNFPRRKGIQDPLEMLIDEFKEYHRAMLMQAAMEAAIDAHTARDFESLLASMREGVAEVDAFSADNSSTIRTGDWDTFERIMDEHRLLDGSEVIPTGFPTINDALHGGIRRKQLAEVIAPTKAGKTTLALQIAISAQASGHKVVFQTYELSEEQVYMKYLAQKLQIPPRRLENGKLLSSHEGKVDELVKDHEDGRIEDVVFVSTIKDVDTASVVIDEEGPDLLVIDGAYMMEVAEKENRTNSLESMLRGLKALALKNDVCILVTTQALESKMSGTRLKQTSAAHSSAWGQYADVMLGLEMVEVDHEPMADQRNLRILLNRFGNLDEVNLNWDWDQLVFEEA